MLHKATSDLAARYETVVVEDLNVSGMISNKKLARAVSDQGFGQARRMLVYKTRWNGGTLVIVVCGYPSSKRCHAGRDPVKQEPGTQYGDKTGTAVREGRLRHEGH